MADMTNRLDRLEAAGLVERRLDPADRRLDPADRRSFLVRLTERGLLVIDDTLTEHAADLARLAAPLGRDEMETLAGLLRKPADGPLGERDDGMT
ncbi:MarR family winged helix-turn-helix transcriptional regulator [Nonomuraea fuscirosea]|uniref:MarR family winged helix-turn-helix transcriptional regulator n=1 Tax=Nonomuraea fuscirosea TaxID=1291556 RepID=UPI0033F6991E